MLTFGPSTATHHEAVPDVGSDYRVMVAPAGTPWGHVLVTLDHIPTWRRKSGTAQAGGAARMAACLKEDIESDLRDVAEGTLSAGFGRFAPDEDRVQAPGLKP